MIRQSHLRRYEYNMLRYAFTFLTCIVVVSYLPGFASFIDNQYQQPSLVKFDQWTTCKETTADCTKGQILNTKSTLLGWYKYYSIFDKTHEKLEEINKDLQQAGTAYILFATFSLVMFLLSYCAMIYKSKYINKFFMMLSWITLIIGISVYMIEFQDEIIEDMLKNMKENAGTFADVEWKWRFGAGLICNIFGLVIMPALACLI